jgi:hypothetical protein
VPSSSAVAAPRRVVKRVTQPSVEESADDDVPSMTEDSDDDELPPISPTCNPVSHAKLRLFLLFLRRRPHLRIKRRCNQVP